MNLYPWQDTQWNILQRAYEQNTFPHALLLHGQEGLGIDDFAVRLSTALFCDDFSRDDTALEPKRDWALLKAGSHPDFALVEPEEPGKQIKVEPIREMMDFLQRTAQYGRYKIVIITPAENLNRNAANALLKTLEEPPKDSLLILVCHDPSRLPVTIRSRCQKLEFRLNKPTEALQWLQQHHNEDNVEAALRVTGAPLTALEYLETRQSEWRQDLARQLLEARREDIEVIHLAEQWKTLDASLLITTLQGFFHDLLKLRISHNDIYLRNLDVASDLRVLAKQLDLFDILKGCQQLNTLHQRIDSTVSYNLQNLFEEFLLYWRQCKLKT